jgi:hypothetical protein
MAKITIAGDAIVITSSRTLEEIRTLEKYKPEALVLKDENGEVYFKVGTGSGNINKYGVSFGDVSRTGDGTAVLTMVLNDVTDAVKFASDNFGVALINLNKVEAQFDEALNEVSEQQAEILANITIA